MNYKIEQFKEHMHQSMLMNFKKNGFLVPVIFFLFCGRSIIEKIPQNLLSSPEGKDHLANAIKHMCEDPRVTAAGIIIEANAAKIKADNELINSIFNGDVKVSELKEKKDIIIMVFSTFEGEEMISYVVDSSNKIIVEPFNDNDDNKGSYGGRFSNFFSWNKN
jgi:hypothetical protein